MKLEDTESSVVRYQGLQRILQEAQEAEYQLDKCRIVLKKRRRKKEALSLSGLVVRIFVQTLRLKYASFSAFATRCKYM